MRQGASGATTFLCWQGGFPDIVRPPLQRHASLDTINDATMRLCRIDIPAPCHPIAPGLSRAGRGEATPTALLLTEPAA
jgi:hypothetical protein